jgi:rare lipoprotein A
LPAPGSKEKPKMVASTPPPKAAASPAPPPPPSQLDGAQLAKQKVQTVPVKATQIFIQAGAFLRYDNANRLSATLSPLGPTNVTQVDTKAGPMFRVRLGPIKTVNEADALLERVIGAGHPDARIVVD